MSVNLDKVSVLVRGVDALLALNGQDSITDELLVDELIGKALALSAYEFSSEEMEAVKRDITWKYKVYTTPGESILADYDQCFC